MFLSGSIPKDFVGGIIYIFQDNYELYLTGIKYLDLNINCNITDIGLKYLEGIKYLILYSNKNITNEGLKHLKGIKKLIFNKKNW